MRIAARLAMDPVGVQAGQSQAAITPRGDFHGRNVVLRALSSIGFEAECTSDYPPGALVRLRLPVSGVAIARIHDCRAGKLRGEFLNPLAEARLARTLGSVPTAG